jgi:hypothetical protein
MLEFIELLTAAACRPDHHLVLAAGGNDGLNDIEQLIHSGAVDGVVPANVLSADERVAALARNEFRSPASAAPTRTCRGVGSQLDNHAGVATTATY